MGLRRGMLVSGALALLAAGCSVRAEPVSPPAPAAVEQAVQRVYSSDPLGFLEEMGRAERQPYKDFLGEFRARVQDDGLSAVVLGETHDLCNASGYAADMVRIIREERQIGAFYDEAVLMPFAAPGDLEIGVYQLGPCPGDLSGLPYRTFRFGWSDPTELDEITDDASEGLVVTYTGSLHASPHYIRNLLGIVSHGMDSLTPPVYHGDPADAWPTVQEAMGAKGMESLAVNITSVEHLLIAATEGAMRLSWAGEDVEDFSRKFDALLREMETDTAYRIDENTYVILTWQVYEDFSPLAVRLKDAMTRLENLEPEHERELQEAGCEFRELKVRPENSNVEYVLGFDAGPGIVRMGGWMIRESGELNRTCEAVFYDDGSESVSYPSE